MIKEKYQIKFNTPEGETKIGEAKEGETILEVAHNNNIDLEGFSKKLH